MEQHSDSDALVTNHITADKFNDACAKIIEGNLQRAGEICSEIINGAPDHADAWYLLGVIMLQTGNAEAALGLLNQAVELLPNQPHYRVNLGIAYLRMGNQVDAQDCFDKAEAIDAYAYAIAVSDPKTLMEVGQVRAIQAKGGKNAARLAALSELTLIILTYNRPAMVQRLLSYLRTQAPEITLVLLDHGDAESQENNAAAITSFFPSIRHIRLPIETPLIEVMATGSAGITTQFSALCPDDDIPVIDGIINAVSMLIYNPRMACAQGYALSLTETDSAMYFGPIEDWVPSCDDDAPLSRLFSLMRRYQPVFFGFYRTEILVWVLREFVVAKISNLMFQEFFHAALVCSRGTIGRSPSISLWRRVAGSHTDRRTIHPYHQMIDSPTMLGANYLEFREQIVPYYLDDAQPDSISQESGVRRLIDLVFMQFLVRHINYGELDEKIRQLLGDLHHDYFPMLTAQEQDFDTQNFMQIPDFKDIDVFVSNQVFNEAAQVTQEMSIGAQNQGRERKISIKMLMGAIKSALDYRSS